MRLLLKFTIVLGMLGSAWADLQLRTQIRIGESGFAEDRVIYQKENKERVEILSGNPSTTIRNCETNESIEVNPKTQMYWLHPTIAPQPASPPQVNAPACGTLHYRSDEVDTGKRQVISGVEMRYIKMTHVIRPDPDSCSQINWEQDIEGWFVALPPNRCGIGVESDVSRLQRSARGDRVEVEKHDLPEVLVGGDVTVTTKVRGDVKSTNHVKMISVSTESLPDSLFAVPTGYTEAQSKAELQSGSATVEIAGDTKEPIFSLPAGNITPPRVITRVQPKYTLEARAAAFEGTSVLAVTIGSDGKARDISVKKSSRPDLDAKAMETVRKWKFEPARKDGTPVAVRVNIEVQFRLF